MGDEIDHRHFDAMDFSRFRQNLDVETAHISRLFENNEFSQRGDIVGFELEACIVDQSGRPSGVNSQLLSVLNNPLVVPELAEHNIELNGSPMSLTGRVFTRLHDELLATWKLCQKGAETIDRRLVGIGILPTVRADILNSDHMSDMVRYHALNDRIMALRDGAPLRISIDGEESLRMTHHDVMLEAAGTSFQVHLQCKPERAVCDFNTAQILSAPMVALSANSPYVFGKNLWSESRVPMFEQAVDIGALHPSRVSFGDGYIDSSIYEIFEENVRHPILLPFVQDQLIDKYAHLRFQNGTVWRWNRPLIGFDYDGQPHLRIEHRVIPAGPTIHDCVANCAAYVGLVRGLSDPENPLSSEIPFDVARDNFYEAARLGLDATITWTGGRKVKTRDLILSELIPAAEAGLTNHDIPFVEVERFLHTVRDRVESGQNGTEWQRLWVQKHGDSFEALTRAYMDLQDSEDPIHTWPI